MSEPQDPLRSLFRQAGEFGQSRATSAPVAHIADRGRRAYRRRLAAVAAGTCLVIGGSSAAAVALLANGHVPAPPAVSPSPAHPSPVRSDGTQPDAPTGAPTRLPSESLAPSGSTASSGTSSPPSPPSRTATTPPPTGTPPTTTPPAFSAPPG
ncbi:hypothetical protein ACFU9F_03925 [Streptomyces zhihengii]|uniref:hypothetical protein n=1 Tax=Streptomyces zhihengii TaxID=1818004 RepID=UPI0036C18A55